MTQALVIGTTKYGEADLIAHCFLLDGGRQSFLLKGLFKKAKSSMRPAHFQPLMQLELTPSPKRGDGLGFIKSVNVDYVYQTLYINPIKQSLLFFLSEFLQKVIPHTQESDVDLFQYLVASLQWLDLHENVGHFHLFFMMKITRYLGFYPDVSSMECPYFDLYLGQFKAACVGDYVLNESDSNAFKHLLKGNFESSHRFDNKRLLLEQINTYLKLHLHAYQPPKSTAILNTILRP